VRLKEPFVKKHIHIWVKGALTPNDLSTYYYIPGYTIDRTCGECGLKQSASISAGEKDSLPASVLHLGDWNWR